MWGLLGDVRQETESSSFLQKRTKKLLSIWCSRWGNRRVEFAKVFWFFFAKKNCFLPYAAEY
jgi:hypothetical protein